MSKTTPFKEQCQANAKAMASSDDLRRRSVDWIRATAAYKYTYNYTSLGRPIIQFPQDMVAIQELVWRVKPDLIIETGIAHGGSLVMSASMLVMLDYCDAVENGTALVPGESARRVLGIDIDIRSRNRSAIESHPLAHKIDMIQGSSIAPEIVAQVRRYAEKFERIFICLDSNHAHDHVLAELEAYAPLTSTGSYCVVFDTVVEDMPTDMFPDRPWGKSDNPKTAVHEYRKRLKEEGRKAVDGADLAFDIDESVENKLLITVAPDGYLKRVS